MTGPSFEAQVRFLVNVQRLLNEGSFVATYKYALLLAITDLCVEKGDDSGAPLRLTTRDLAEKFIVLYWPQGAPYVAVGRDGGSPVSSQDTGRPAAVIAVVAREVAEPSGAIVAVEGARVLKQNTGRQAKIIEHIARERARYGGSLVSLRADARNWRTLVGAVAATVTTMPLWKLQTVGHQPLTFLYDRGAGPGEIELLPGVAYCFRRFHALVRDLVQAAWVRFIRRVPDNAAVLGEAHELGEFLFGSERGSLDEYRPILRDMQRDECFYCQRPLQGPGEVDHFVPWSWYSFDLGHNFVLAHAGCNNDKGDRLAAVDHLQRWCERNVQARSELDQRLDHARLLHDLPATWQVTRWAYAQAEAAGAQVWVEPKDKLTVLSPGWRSLLDDAAAVSFAASASTN